MQMVFLPFARQAATLLREEGRVQGRLTGHAATPSLLGFHDYDQSSLEDAEYAALSYAGVRAVLSEEGDPLRLVLAAELPDAAVIADPDDGYGRTDVTELRWQDVRALFVDEPAAAAAVAAARAAAAGQALAEALSLPAVAKLLDEHDLLWYAPEELDRLP